MPQQKHLWQNIRMLPYQLSLLDQVPELKLYWQEPLISGNASRSLKDSETSAGIVENIVAIDGIAVVLDKANTVTNLTKEQLVQMYTGEINNWSAVGGADQPIVVVGRESGSGTRDAFEELLEIKRSV